MSMYFGFYGQNTGFYAIINCISVLVEEPCPKKLKFPLNYKSHSEENGQIFESLKTSPNLLKLIRGDITKKVPVNTLTDLGSGPILPAYRPVFF